MLNPKRSSTMLRVIAEMVDVVMLPGAVNSLSQKLLTLTVPGMPDVYQGTDGWDLSLVDPDNRRAVDFSVRRRWLSAGDSRGKPHDSCPRLVREWRTGEIKHTVVRRALALRTRHADLFAAGDYTPLTVAGAHADRVLAFARTFRGAAAVVIVPRLVAPLLEESDVPLVPAERWGDTRVIIPDGILEHMANELTGEPVEITVIDGERSLAVSRVLQMFPVALLSGEAYQ
jgi:(1->4)-alpha-D-glucan 1-alpha-D-glucosylmutase